MRPRRKRGMPYLARASHDGTLGSARPAKVKSTSEQIEKAFRALIMLDESIILFLNLPLSSVVKLAIKKEIDRIGQV